jgi:predicted transcriptional regulator
MATVTIGIASRDEVSARAISAMHGEQQGMFITFPTSELLLEILSGQRWLILAAMIGAGPLSLDEIGNRVSKGADVVRDDVTALLHAGVIEREGNDLMVFPYDEVRVDFILRAMTSR